MADRDRAIARGQVLIEEGADVVDVGGESTRPGADPVSVDEELRRVLPVIEALAGQVRISIDTTKEEVAEAAVEAGASLINDVSASLWPVAARTGAGWVAMHRQGTPTTMQTDPHYDDVVAEVTGMLVERAGQARAGGVDEVWIDPGIGFGKTVDHNVSSAGLPGGPGGDRLSGSGGDQPQDLPRPSGRCRPADSRWPWTSAWPARWPPPPGP